MVEFWAIILVVAFAFLLFWIFNLPDKELGDVNVAAQAQLNKFLQELTDLSADPAKLVDGLGLLKRADYNFERSQTIYQLALKFLEANPEKIPAKIFALEVGRWSLSLGRKDGLITGYDEAALQNDIQVRSR